MPRKAKRRDVSSSRPGKKGKPRGSSAEVGRVNRPERLLLILNLISSRQSVSIAELAAECGVSERTIYRDVSDISRANFPIYQQDGFHMVDGKKLPPLNITDDEYAVLKSVLESWPLATTAPYRQMLRTLGAKLERFYRESKRYQSVETSPPVAVRSRTTDNLQKTSVQYAELTAAIQKHEIVSIRYESLDSPPARRRVNPYYLVFRGRSFYLVGFCHKREDFRIFRLSRISAVKSTGKSFRPDSSITLESLFEHSWDVYFGSPVFVRVRLHGRAHKVAISGRHHPSEKIIADGKDAIIYSATVNSIEEFGRWVLGFGGEAEVLEPKKLKEWVREQAANALAANSDPRER